MVNGVELSVVIPVYNSAGIFPELYRRLVAELDKTVGSFEIVAVVDGCADDSFDVISRIAEADPRVKAVEFSRNFGHQAAVTAGLALARGGMVAVMDDDLEDPPEALPLLIGKAREGYDVVYGVRRKRKRQLLHRVMYSLFYRVLGGLVDIDLPYDAGDFCIMSGRVAAVLNSMPENNRYLRGMRSWSGFRQTGVEYERGERYASVSGYSFRKYVAFALDAIFSFSYKPLKLVSLAGFSIACLSFVFGVKLVFDKLTGRVADVPGWASLFLSVLFFSGIQLLSIGIIGEYVARIYDEVKQRPKYIIKRGVGMADGGDDGK